MNIVPGDELFYAPYQRWQGSPRRVRVTKVGRKWITIDFYDMRFSVDDLIAEESTNGRLYATEDEYFATRHRELLVTALHNATGWRGEREITYEQAKACAKILGLDVPEPAKARIEA